MMLRLMFEADPDRSTPPGVANPVGIRRWWIDAAFTLLLAVSAFMLATRFLPAWGGTPDLAQEAFAPAVFSACHGSFTNFEVRPGSPLDEFLRLRRPSLSCADVPGEVEPLELNNVQATSRYLLQAAALVWRSRGVSWSALDVIAPLLLAVTIAATYLFLSLTLWRPLALFGAGWFLLSTHHLVNLPHLRDYAKAPFVLLLLACLTWLVRRPRSGRGLLLMALTYGIILGIGLGFRMDMRIMVPPFIATTLFFTELRGPRHLRSRAYALLVMGVATLALSWPVHFERYGNTGGFFVASYGFLGSFDSGLEVRNSMYSRGHGQLDVDMGVTLQDYWANATRGRQILRFGTDQFEHASRRYFLDTLRTYPADAWIRGIASSMRVMDAPFRPLVFRRTTFWQFARPSDLNLQGPLWQATAALHTHVLGRLDGLGAWLAILALTILAALNLRAAIFAALVVLYLTAYPSLDFEPRHFFHLEPLGLWALLFAAQYSLLVAVPKLRRRAVPLRWGTAAAFTIVTLALLGAVTVVLRQWQSRTAGALLDRYSTADRESLPLRLMEIPERSDRTAIRFADFPSRSGVAVMTGAPGRDPRHVALLLEHDGSATYGNEILAVVVDPRRCTGDFASLTFRYNAKSGPYDPTTTIDVPLDRARQQRAGPVTLYVPVHEVAGYAEFDAIEIPRHQAGCISAIRRLLRPRDFALQPLAILPADWNGRPLYQTLERGLPNPFRILAGNLKRAPEVVVDRDVDGWRLLGYDLGRTAFSAGAPAPLRLHWIPADGSVLTQSATFQHLGGHRWVQTVFVENALADGGFDATRSLRAVPESIYGAAGGAIGVKTEGGNSFVSIDNAPAVRNGGVSTSPIPVDPERLYLQAATARAPDGGMVIGRLTLPAQRLTPVVPETPSADWTRYADVFRGKATTTHVSLWLMNYQTDDRVDFDDVMLVELGSIAPCFRDSDRCGSPLRASYLGSERKPRFKVGETLDGWRLIGVDVPDSVLDGRPGDVWLHWLPPSGARPQVTDTLRTGPGTTWIQRITAHGLLGAARFENEMDLAAFSADIYNAPPSVRSIEREPDGNRHASLQNTDREQRSSLVSTPFEVEPSHTYLQIARVRATGGNAWIGRQWLPQSTTSYLATNVTDGLWTTYASIVRPPAAANAASVMLLNYDSTGKASFDDTAFIDLGATGRCATPICGLSR